VSTEEASQVPIPAQWRTAAHSGWKNSACTVLCSIFCHSKCKHSRNARKGLYKKEELRGCQRVQAPDVVDPELTQPWGIGRWKAACQLNPTSESGGSGVGVESGTQAGSCQGRAAIVAERLGSGSSATRDSEEGAWAKSIGQRCKQGQPIARCQPRRPAKSSPLLGAKQSPPTTRDSTSPFIQLHCLEHVPPSSRSTCQH
jgi:hypothetical protein